MVNVEKIRVIQGADLLSIAMTEADMIIAVDRDTNIVSGTCPMPSSPKDGQIFILSSRIQITNLTMDAAGKAIYGVVNTLAAGSSVGWIFDTLSDAWFRYINPAYSGYAINVQALTSSPTDAQTIFFGMLPKAPVTTAATSKVFIRQAGIIRRAEIYCFSGTAGTNEAWPMSIRLNNTTDTLIASVAAATSERVFSNTNLNIAVAAGDYIEIKCVNPTWVTNPLTTIFGGYVYIE